MIDLLVDKNVRLAKIGNHSEDRFRLEEKNTPVIIEETKILTINLKKNERFLNFISKSSVKIPKKGVKMKFGIITKNYEVD